MLGYKSKKHFVLLLSIHPRYSRLILTGEKTYEFRKSIPKKSIKPIILIYETAPTSKIVGFFIAKKILKLPPKILWEKTKKRAGISKEKFFEYFNEKEFAYAYRIQKAVEKEIPTSIFDDFTPPQNFMYVKYEKIKKYIY